MAFENLFYLYIYFALILNYPNINPLLNTYILLEAQVNNRING